jgi:ParB family chromosome partitioning protein
MKKKNLSTPEIQISRIVLNPEQPRRLFDAAELEELAGSIREHGVIQPIAVEECGDDYILHDGERRLRAAKMAGLKVIPAVVSPPLNGTGPRERLERALVSNLQRAEMHIIEEGLAYQRLVTEFGLGVEGVARRVGKHISRVSYAVQLVTRLEPEIQQWMLERKLPSSDSRILPALLSIPAGEERIALCQALAQRKATARMVIVACSNYLAARADTKKGSPARRMVSRELPEWDALYQLGKVPPWPVVTEAVMETCDTCPLRAQASPQTCRDCALVIGLRRMMEAVS